MFALCTVHKRGFHVPTSAKAGPRRSCVQEGVKGRPDEGTKENVFQAIMRFAGPAYIYLIVKFLRMTSESGSRIRDERILNYSIIPYGPNELLQAANYETRCPK